MKLAAELSFQDSTEEKTPPWPARRPPGQPPHQPPSPPPLGAFLKKTPPAMLKVMFPRSSCATYAAMIRSHWEWSFSAADEYNEVRWQDWSDHRCEVEKKSSKPNESEKETFIIESIWSVVQWVNSDEDWEEVGAGDGLHLLGTHHIKVNITSHHIKVCIYSTSTILHKIREMFTNTTLCTSAQFL